MKTVKVILFLVMAMSMNISCSAQTNKKEESEKVSRTDKVEVYYFHYTRRCATCNAVENVSKETVNEFYGEKVSFADYNLDEKTGKAKAEELEVSGQSLLIVSGDTKINLTNEGFLNARANPEKLKAIIKEKIDALIN